MTIIRLNPSGLHETPGYAHVTVVAERRLVMLSGQCPLDESGTLVGADDPIAQADQVEANILSALASVGASPENVVRTVVYVASSDRNVLASVWHRLRTSGLREAFTTASTLVGVACLGFAGQLVEIDVTAALA